MFKKVLSTLFFVLLFLQTLSGVIVEVDSLDKIQQELSQLDTSALVIFDVDDTILMSTDAAFKPCGADIKQKYFKALNKKQKECFYALHSCAAEEALVDKAIPALIYDLQKRNIKVIGLTDIETGECGCISCVEDWRLAQLKKNGIDFSVAFPGFCYVIFTVVNPHEGRHPIFKNGVLFSVRQPKGEVLMNFLAKVGWTPKKVVAVDDSLKKLETIQQACTAQNIECLAFHYQAPAVYNCQVDPELADFQFRYLLQHNQWLSDTEARKTLKDAKE